MISHSNMMAVAGCVVMAGLAIAAVGLHVDSDGGLSNVFSGRDNVPVNENPLNTSVPSLRSGLLSMVHPMQTSSSFCRLSATIFNATI